MNKLNAYIFAEKVSNYSMYNAVVLAEDEDEAWELIAAEWNNDLDAVRDKLVLAVVKPLVKGVLDVSWYCE